MITNLASLTSVKHDESLSKFMPQSVQLDNIDGRWGIKACVKVRYEDNPTVLQDIIAFEWDKMYRKYADYIVSQTIGRDMWLVHKAQADMYVDSYGFTPVFNLRLFVDTFVTCSSKVVIPEIEWEYSKINGYQIKEWRCGYCRSPNVAESRHCTQCGSPRALLIQEM